MKKSKLFGSRLVENVFLPKTPKVIMLADYDSINQHFEEGDILDANSVKRMLLNNKPEYQTSNDVYDCSPRGERFDLTQAIDILYQDDKRNNFNFITFIDSATGLRVVYQNLHAGKNTSVQNWKQLLTEDDAVSLIESEIKLYISRITEVEIDNEIR